MVGIGRPFAQGLPQKGDGGNEKQDDAFSARFFFGDFERSESFARTASHNEFAPPRRFEVFVSGVDSGDLVRHRRFFRGAGGLAR